MLQASAFGWPLLHRPGPPPGAACPLSTSAPEHAQPPLKSRSSRTLHRSVSGYTQAAPGLSAVHYHLGLVYARQGKTEEARRQFEEALKSPGFAEAGETRKALEALK